MLKMLSLFHLLSYSLVVFSCKCGLYNSFDSVATQYFDHFCFFFTSSAGRGALCEINSMFYYCYLFELQNVRKFICNKTL